MSGNFQSQRRPYRSVGGGRGGRGGRTPWRPNIKPAPIRELPPPLGEIREIIDRGDISTVSCPREHTKIMNPQYISSYNITGASTPTIIIPGAPPKWTPLATRQQLREDSSEYLRDNNAANFPDYPMEPAIRSIFVSNPTFDCSSVDVFGCASTLGSIIRFIHGSQMPFSFVVHIVGDTAFFLRREISPKALIKEVRGYGHTFPEAYTMWEPEVKGSISHQRIIQYQFGGKNLLVRFESDGFLKDKEPNSSTSTGVSDLGNEDPEDSLTRLELGPKKPSSPVGIEIQQKGHNVAQSSLFDLKTRSSYKKDQDILAEELPRLWIRQITQFILAFHNTGVFNDIRVEDVTSRVLTWERNNEANLRRLAVIIQRIILAAKNADGQKIEVRCSNEGPLELRNVPLGEGWNALPSELAGRWRRGTNDGESSDHGAIGGVELGNRHNPASSRDYDSDEEEKDYTACSAEECGYCGRCSY